jgi:hypothetical protein
MASVQVLQMIALFFVMRSKGVAWPDRFGQDPTIHRFAKLRFNHT